MVRLERSVDTPMGVEHMKSILVVDDDSTFAQLLGDAQKGDGHRVTRARNGVEALTFFPDQAFDLLLIDIRLPELDGLAFYHELERYHPGHASRVMFMTSGAVGAEMANLLLRKPLAAEEISAAVRRFFLAAGGVRVVAASRAGLS